MKWLDRITTRAASGVETRALPGAGAGMGNTLPNGGATPNGPVKAGTAPITYSGPGAPLMPDFNGQAAIQNGYEQSVWVMRGLQTIADTIAALPFVAGMDPDNPAITNPQAPLARLLGPATPRAPGGPNPQWSSQQYWSWQTIQKLATGKMAAELQVDKIAKGPDGKSPAIIGLWPLVSYLLNPISSPGGGVTYFDGFQYQLSTGVRNMKPEEVFYAWKKSLNDPRQPESLLRAAGLPISISVAIERYTWALLQNGMVATHVVTSAPLEEPDNRRAWEEQFISNFTGFDQAGKPIFAYADVENGKVTDAFNIQSIAQTSQQAELLAMAAWVKTEILVALGVPESLIGNACLKADEMVRLADGGRRKAADLVGSTFQVLTSTPDGPAVRDAYASWNEVEPCFAVTTESGRQLMCNARHPLFAATYVRTKDVVRGPLGRTKPGAVMAAPRHCPGIDVKGWTRLQDLAVGDLLAVTTEFPTHEGRPYDVDAAKVLGYMIGDGCCGGDVRPNSGGGGQSITFAAERTVHSDDFASSVEALGDTVRRYKTKVGGVPVWGVAGGAVRKLLIAEGLLGSRGYDKHIPDGIWSADRVAQREFLSRLYATDGCASLGYVGRGVDLRGHKSYGTACISYSSVSSQLAHDIQEMLLRFAIPSRIGSQWSSTGGIVKTRSLVYKVDVSVAEDVVRFADIIGIFGKEEAVAACRAHAVEQIGRKRTPRWRTRHLNPGLRWEKIKSIEPVGVDATVAITVPEGNTYLSMFYEHNSQRIYANADSEERTFWTGRVINTVAELQDDINTFLAPKLGPEVGWFDLSRVAALQPPTPFMQPQLTDLISSGIMTIAEAQQQLGVADSGFIDTSDVLLGEESSSTGAGAPGKASAPQPELRGWTWENRGMNLTTYRKGTWRVPVYLREHIDVRPEPVIDVTSKPLDTRGYDRAEKILDRVVSLREKREANTLADKVYAYLQQNYPPSVLGWVKKATWKLDDAVPLDEIKMARRPGGRDLDKVEAISDAIQGGKKMEPVVLVDIGGDRYVVADGYHRTLAFQKAGKKTIAAYVASGVGDHGPWDTAMHDAKLNRARGEIEKRTPNTAEASSTHVPVGPGELWHDPTIHLPDYVEHLANALRGAGHGEQESIEMAVGIIRGWASGRASHGKVHPDVQAAAAKAIAEWDALKASHNKSKRSDDAWTELARVAKECGAEFYFDQSGTATRAFVAETGSSGPGAVYKGNNPDASGAGLLLPLGPTKKPVPREAELVGPHRYLPDPSNAKRCLKCGKGPLAAIHKAKAKADPAKRDSVATVEALLGRPVESRHRGPDHVHVPTGHANTPVRKRLAMKQAHKAALAGYEQAFTDPMRALFAKQQVTTLSRLNGRRGRVMVRRATEAILEARASSQPGSPPTPPSDGVPVTTAAPTSPAAPVIDPASVFDQAFWAAETAKVLLPAYNKTATASTQQVRDQLGPATGITDEMHSQSNAAVRAALNARAQTVSSSISQTTFQAIAKQLGDGLEAGESIPQLSDRVKSVFQDASDNRATLISRTESHSALGVAADGYINSLPQGIVAGSEWISVADARTRHDHRLADGQRQPLGVPFRVGPYSLRFPGDPAAPLSETANCRCGRAFIPQSQAHLLLQQPPKDFTYNPQAPTAA